MTDWMHELGFELEQERAQEEAQQRAEQEQLVAQQSQTFDVGQIAELCRLSLDWLAGTVMPLKFIFNFPLVLLAAWTLLVKSCLKERCFDQIALGIPRGHAKTTLIKLLIIFCILFTKKRFILIVANTSQLAENILADVAAMLEEDNVKKVFGNWKLGMEMDRQDLKKFGFRGRNITIYAIGQQGAVRGANIGNDRPDVIIFEDIQSAEDAQSEVISNAIYNWMIGTAMKAKSPFGCTFIFCGNMYPGPHSILKKLQKNKTWIKFISGAILADGTALWPELRPIESLIEELNNDIEADKPEIFFAEVLNDTDAGINTKTDLSKIKPWPWGPDELPQGKFIVIDPSGDTAKSDDCVIGYAEVYDGTPGLKRIHSAVMSPGNTIRQALLMALQTNTRVILVENVAYQASLLYWFTVVAEQLELTGFHFLPITAGVKSKNSRIMQMLKSLTADEIAVHDTIQTAVKHQIANWNPLKTKNVDGILDVLTYLPKALEQYQEIIACDTDLELMQAQAASVSGQHITNPF